MLTSYSAPREMKCPDVSYLQPHRCPAGVASWTRSARSCATWSSPRAARYPVSAKIRGERSKDVNEISPVTVQFEINFLVTFREIRNDIKNTLWWIYDWYLPQGWDMHGPEELLQILQDLRLHVARHLGDGAVQHLQLPVSQGPPGLRGLLQQRAARPDARGGGGDQHSGQPAISAQTSSSWSSST